MVQSLSRNAEFFKPASKRHHLRIIFWSAVQKNTNSARNSGLLSVDRTVNITAASIYHLLATREHTILVDEGDNLGLWTNNVLRAIFNAGHRRGGAIRRFVGGRSRKFPVFAPLPLMHRAIVVNMQRHAPGSARLLQLDEADPTFPAARAEIQKWAATCSLAREPEMPPQLHNRMANNWSVLLAIADDLGRGEEARAAAVALSAHRSDEDHGITLLTDIRTIFLALGIDRIAIGSDPNSGTICRSRAFFVRCITDNVVRYEFCSLRFYEILQFGRPVQSVYSAGPTAILHRPDPIMIVAEPSFVVELAYVKLPF